MILIFRDKQIGGQNQQANYKLNYKETAPKNIIIAFGCWDEKVVLIYSVADSLSISFIAYETATSGQLTGSYRGD